jgi:hypothetical protein
MHAIEKHMKQTKLPNLQIEQSSSYYADIYTY